MNIEQFRATRHTPTADEYAMLAEQLDPSCVPAQQACHLYEGGCLIHEADGQFWVHAWWYAPLPYATLEEAEVKLLPWYLEFQ